MSDEAERGATVAQIQGGYFFVTGIWPWISMRTFEMVTGPKTDDWLVKTVGVLVSVIGGVLAWAGLRKQVSPEVRALAIGSAASLAGVDVLYVARRRISPIYLLDAALELVLIVAWALSGRRGA
jgi:hypothetical protein